MADHPVKVPPELVRRLREEAASSTAASQLGTAHARQDHFIEYIADKAAQWGWDQREHEVQEQADQELEAVEHWLITGPYGASIVKSAPTLVGDLRAAMRPKPPSLAEQGMEALRGIKSGTNNCREQDQAVASLAAALTRLAELEAQQ